MTIVVTTASKNGISVVGDSAVSVRLPNGEITTRDGVCKIYYSEAANISLAFWGSANIPGTDLESWATTFVHGISKGDALAVVSERLANTLKILLQPHVKGWSDWRRGVHVAGYVDGLPHIYHVHTGDPDICHHPPRVYKDYPFLYADGVEPYRAKLESNARAQVRNGFHELFASVSSAASDIRAEVEKQLGKPVPANTLGGQLAFDKALVRFAAGLIESAEYPQQVSDDVNSFAFNASGLVVEPAIRSKDRQSELSLTSDVRLSPTHSIV